MQTNHNDDDDVDDDDDDDDDDDWAMVFWVGRQICFKNNASNNSHSNVMPQVAFHSQYYELYVVYLSGICVTFP